jgi:uncharacterized repeat protein (TIGR04052 family)
VSRDGSRSACVAVLRTALRLAALGLAWGCTQSGQMEVEIPFAAVIGDTPFSCQSSRDVAADHFQPNDLRLYVHDVELLDDAGTAAPVTLSPDGVFQAGSLALLDFEDGTGNCANGTSATHTTLTGHVRRGNYRALRFTLGVPFALNHADPGLADPPLNLGRMQWGWQAGYKFLRFEGTDAAGHGLRFHLGSTGCEGTIGHITRCARPNRGTIALPGFRLGHSRVLVQLSALLASFDGHHTRSCMSDVDATDCVPMFSAIGIDLASGSPSAAQTLFALSPS